ncbi:MAG: YIP1 family protein [Mariprofundaceae bacterium]|nr:YIP1 family protein [Mariprofundaceae bacterium]
MSNTDSTSMIYFESNRPAGSFIAALKNLVTRPREFFAGMPFAVFYSSSLFFASIVIFMLTFLAVPAYNLGMLFMLPFTWGSILIGMWMLSNYMSWSVKAFAGSKLTTANAFQLSAYAFAPMMFAGLSWGGFAAFLWSMYLLWLGLTAHCRISGARAVAVIIVPVIVVAMIGGSMSYALAHLKIH